MKYVCVDPVAEVSRAPDAAYDRRLVRRKVHICVGIFHRVPNAEVPATWTPRRPRTGHVVAVVLDPVEERGSREVFPAPLVDQLCDYWGIFGKVAALVMLVAV